jgi:signal transduction histidine kinase
MMSIEAVRPGSKSARRPLARAQVRRVGTVFLRLRPILVAPAVVLSWLWILPVVPRAQAILLMLASGSMLAFFTIEAVLARRREVGERWLLASLVVTQLALLAVSAGTGALGSPYLPLVFAPTVTAFAAFGRDRRSALALGILVFGVLVLATVPPNTPFAALPAELRDRMTACTVLLGGALLLVSVAGLSDAHEDAGRDLDRLRADVVQGMSVRASEVEGIGAKVAHEIRNPLTAIRGLVDLLAKDATEPKAVRRFEIARGEITRVEAILRDYLSFARPLAELRREPVDLGELARRVVDLLDARADSAGVRLAVRVAAPAPMSADPARLTEALLNIVGNAIEACERGGTVVIAVDAHAIEVIDDGRGMSPELVARIGTPYVSEHPGGIGLGVALARQVALQHGGTLEYESTLGRGTRAIIRLPASGGHA